MATTIQGAGAPSAAASPSGNGSASIGDQFIKLLVAQLSNQDPLNPMDPTAMTAQLTQMSSLQQLESINRTLALNGSQNTSALAEASSAVGKNAQIEMGPAGEVAFGSDGVSIHYDFAGNPPFGAQLVGADPSGAIVGSWPMEGSLGDVQAGKVPEGTRFSVQARYANGLADDRRSGFSMLSQNMAVQGVALSNGTAYVVGPKGERAEWLSVVGLR